jgi:hypothetical protein
MIYIKKGSLDLIQNEPTIYKRGISKKYNLNLKILDQITKKKSPKKKVQSKIQNNTCLYKSINLKEIFKNKKIIFNFQKKGKILTKKNFFIVFLTDKFLNKIDIISGEISHTIGLYTPPKKLKKSDKTFKK